MSLVGLAICSEKQTATTRGFDQIESPLDKPDI